MATLTRQLANSIKVQLNLNFFRPNSTATKLVYAEHGDPIKVVHTANEPIPKPKDDEVVIKMLAAPVNPADINTIQGKYPSRPPLPAVPGNEGVGEVVSVGQGVNDLKEGDRVVPLVNALGTWRTHTVVSKNNVLKVPKKLGLVEAATLTVNPCTAFRMLRDFVDLKPGDTVIQNGANSACGQNVIQICRAWGLRSVNIVRDRAGIDELRCFLQNLGANHVLTEEELRKTEIFKSGKLEKPKLALNCVGGQNALEVMRHLDKGGTMVTYGGMSREPVTVPTSALIFKDLRIRGFWMTDWTKQNADSVDRFEMFEELISMMTTNELQGPAFKMVSFEQYKEALMNTMTIKGMIGKKYILEFK
ncbi:enoyl-[acyl-carrier-protein] reductase, mitochondrial [Tribolium castaneum]|uniref:Enoyl-[acyl-carrier-protein] reductase, mitochondrial n=1 Tax=Tribolium castaneum TaxID=7070 RepID=D6WV48_TRICA|nr:PREDICTED: probable trans-2-enoyl-CoA reductase, mitochondrial [Tribolium castaneum]EFA09077.1 putative trans-2-enoyl-CoA reductase, mitochondrial-like Protein [Tribolium castaneum]|eukprot:XP_974428.1 PREDICTED: probable trans-2-enoyl-CoA reductase, mitochondrial [Tribolium castaneum]